VDEYDAWAAKLSADVESPVWVLYTPQTRRRRFNRCIPSSLLTDSFDLILPRNHGELLSGGVRDKSQLAAFWPEETIEVDTTTSGFGIGVERLVSFLVEARSVAEVVLPHLRTAWN
jgi:aspartyl/asparaginyl-tRNA synthetase